MNLFEIVEKAIRDVDLPVSVTEKKTIGKKLASAFRAEYARPPKIAVIGPTGVGKSSTINALFGTNLPVGHIKAETKSFVKKKIASPKGGVIIYDTPGIGEDYEVDEKNKSRYKDVLRECDVAVWILSAADRRIAYDQIMIRDVVNPANEEVAKRLVVGVNKIDIIHPNNWSKAANVPSKGQMENLNGRIIDIKEKLTKVCPTLTQERIVAYSAEKRYNLYSLFSAMMLACVLERAWVLNSRSQISDFKELVDQEYLESTVVR